jgi:hypothetical protein
MHSEDNMKKCAACGRDLPRFDLKARGIVFLAVTVIAFITTLLFSSKTAWLINGVFSTLPFLIVGWGMYAKGKAAPCPYCGNTPATKPAPASSAPADGAKTPTNH